MTAPLSRTRRGCFVFRGLEEAGEAKHRGAAPFDGSFQLVRDERGHQHCARWHTDRAKLGGGEWVYANGQRVARVVVAWCERQEVEQVGELAS